MKLIDSHAHLTDNAVFNEVEEILERAQAANVKKIINICTDKTTLERGLALSKKHPFFYNTAATTPHDVEKQGESFFPLVEQAAKNNSLVAIGETGLDYHYTHSPKQIQKHYLKKYLHLALESKLAVVIHCREAFKDFFEILDIEYKENGVLGKGALHCFTGTVDEAKEVLDRGWYLSFSGIVTFKKSQELREVAKMVPLSQLLLETDAPYLAPLSRRGKINEPSYLLETAAVVAQAKDLSLEAVAHASFENTLKLFQIKT